MRGLVFLMVGRCQKYGRKLIKRHDAVRLGVGDWLDRLNQLQCFKIGFAMVECAEKREAEKLICPHIEAAEGYADIGAEFRPKRLYIAYLAQIATNGRETPACFIIG